MGACKSSVFANSFWKLLWTYYSFFARCSPSNGTVLVCLRMNSLFLELRAQIWLSARCLRVHNHGSVPQFGLFQCLQCISILKSYFLVQMKDNRLKDESQKRHCCAWKYLGQDMMFVHRKSEPQHFRR